jgi:hypothetical protein
MEKIVIDDEIACVLPLLKMKHLKEKIQIHRFTFQCIVTNPKLKGQQFVTKKSFIGIGFKEKKLNYPRMDTWETMTN